MKKVLGVFVIFGLLVGCNGSDGIRPDIDDILDDIQNQTDESIDLSQFLGTWEIACSYNTQSNLSEINSLTIDATGFSSTRKVYEGQGCVESNLHRESFSNQSVVWDGDSQDIFSVNLTGSEATMTLASQTYVDDYNFITNCGYSDWSLGTEKDVLNKNCSLGLDVSTSPFYTIIKIENGNLYFGSVTAQQDGQSEASRPSSFASEFFVPAN